MNKPLLLIAITAATISLLGCSNDFVETVKNGTLQTDPQRSIGNVFDKYQDCASQKWQHIEGLNGEIVCCLPARSTAQILFSKE